MKIVTLAASGALALSALCVSVPAFAQPGPDHMGRHHHGHAVQVCHMERHHHHKVRACHTEWR